MGYGNGGAVFGSEQLDVAESKPTALSKHNILEYKVNQRAINGVTGGLFGALVVENRTRSASTAIK
jgi:hypothetical protein